MISFTWTNKVWKNQVIAQHQLALDFVIWFFDFILFIEVKQRLVSVPIKDDKLSFEL